MNPETGLKESVRDHYDRLTPLYRELWGIHIHHGYWIDGSESRERAQEQLIELLADRLGIVHGARVLDIGCGMGGTAMYLADRFDARIVGITISPIQAAMAGQLAGRNRSGRCSFAAMDAEAMAIQDQFDIVWSVEALSHMPNRNRVLGDAIALLRPGGKVGVIDWFKAAASITPSDERAYLHPLERGMLVHHLSTLQEYARQIQALGCRLMIQEDLTANVAKTWDICSNLARLPSLLQMAQDHGPDCVRFLQSFHVMRAALQAGVFKYGLITAEKRARL